MGLFFTVAPLIAAMLYAASFIMTKRASGEGVGVPALCFFCNISMFFFYFPAMLISGRPEGAGFEWLPVFCGALYFLGQVFTFASIYVGDVTLMNPLMGAKVIFVTLFAWLMLSARLPFEWVCGSVLTAVAIFVMGFSKSAFTKRTLYTVIFALLACASYALIDVFLQENAQRIGVFYFLGVMNLTVIAFSLVLLPATLKNIMKVRRVSPWKWMFLGLLFIAAQDALFSLSVALSEGGAVAANILYATRGIWAVLMVIAFGRYFGNRETEDKSLALRRLAGAGLLFASVVMVMTA